MQQFIFKVHPNNKHVDGLIVINAPNITKAKIIILSLKNKDIFPHDDYERSELFFESRNLKIQENLNLQDEDVDNCWYIVSESKTTQKEGFVTGCYHAG